MQQPEWHIFNRQAPRGLRINPAEGNAGKTKEETLTKLT